MTDTGPVVEINKAPTALPQSQQPPYQGQQSFVQRLISLTVTLSPGSSGASPQPSTFPGGSNSVTLSGSRIGVRVQNNGAPAGGMARVLVFGLTPSIMNQLSTLGMVFNQVQRNSISIRAGDAVNGLSAVFSGTILFAYGDYNQAPKVPFVLECQSGLIDAVASAQPSSFPGATSVATILAGLARQMNVGFENNGVTVQLASPYLRGNLWTQVQKVARDAHIRAELVNGGTVLAIWPEGGSRTSQTGGPIPLISPTTGMDGYPSFAQNGYLVVRHLFNPQVSFGSTVQVQSSLPQANKTWVVQKLDLALDTLTPKGQWLGTAYCYPLGFSAPVPPGA